MIARASWRQRGIWVCGVCLVLMAHADPFENELIGKGVSSEKEVYTYDRLGEVTQLEKTIETQINVKSTVVDKYKRSEDGQMEWVSRTTRVEDKQWGTMLIVEEPVTNAFNLTITHMERTEKDPLGGYMHTIHKRNKQGDLVLVFRENLARDELGNEVQASETRASNGEVKSSKMSTKTLLIPSD